MILTILGIVLSTIGIILTIIVLIMTYRVYYGRPTITLGDVNCDYSLGEDNKNTPKIMPIYIKNIRCTKIRMMSVEIHYPKGINKWIITEHWASQRDIEPNEQITLTCPMQFFNKIRDISSVCNITIKFNDGTKSTSKIK